MVAILGWNKEGVKVSFRQCYGNFDISDKCQACPDMVKCRKSTLKKSTLRKFVRMQTSRRKHDKKHRR